MGESPFPFFIYPQITLIKLISSDADYVVAVSLQTAELFL